MVLIKKRPAAAMDRVVAAGGGRMWKCRPASPPDRNDLHRNAGALARALDEALVNISTRMRRDADEKDDDRHDQAAAEQAESSAQFRQAAGRRRQYSPPISAAKAGKEGPVPACRR